MSDGRWRLSSDEFNFINILTDGCKSGIVVSELDSQSKGCGFESRLIQILDGNGLKAMPGSIPAPNSGSFMEKYENICSKPTKKHLKKHSNGSFCASRFTPILLAHGVNRTA
jgi:hypothetical protein